MKVYLSCRQPLALDVNDDSFVPQTVNSLLRNWPYCPAKHTVNNCSDDLIDSYRKMPKLQATVDYGGLLTRSSFDF